jgi:hypothetical protein
MRRMARRASADVHQPPEAPPLPQDRQPSADIGAERDLILSRIAELKAELDEQERHLKVIDLLLATDPAAHIRHASIRSGPSDILEVEYTVVR